jgi:hypothetical protein
VTRLHSLGFRGDWSLDVHSDDCLQQPREGVAERARRSALWLGEKVLRRSAPLPNAVMLRRILRT